MSYRNFIMALARGARGKEAAKALILPEIFGGTGSVNSGVEAEVSGTPPLDLPNSLGKPLKAWSVEVSPYQEGTGDPSPDNVRAIHGTDKLTMRTSGKNLVNKNGFTGTNTTRTVLDKGVTVAVANAGNNRYCIQALPIGLLGKTVTIHADISVSSTNYARHALYFGDESGITTSIQIINGTGSKTTTIQVPESLPEGSTRLLLLLYACTTGETSVGTSATYDNLQVELGSTASNYTPYVAPSSTVITLANTLYGGTAEIVVGTGSETMAEVDLGSLTWALAGSGRLNANLPTGIKTVNNSTTMNALCDVYKVTNGQSIANVDMGIAMVNTSNLQVNDSRYNGGNPTAFKTAVTGVKLVYELAAPIPFTTDGHTITIPTGTATAWATAEDGTVDSMDVTYVSKK